MINEEGRFTLSGISSKTYVLEVHYMGYKIYHKEQLVGTLSPFLDIGTIELQPDAQMLNEVVITSAVEDGVSDKMDKKVFSLNNNISQTGG